MELSIIIVNWNSKDYLDKCLKSILTTIHAINFEIIVIDNASYDGCDVMLQTKYANVHFIQSATNLGFARANNEAFKISTGKTILFLNPDTESVGSAVETLHSSLNKIHNLGIVGAKILNSDGSIQTSCIRAFPTISNQFFDSDLLRKLLPSSGLWKNKSLFSTGETLVDVEAITGACMMIKRSIFEEVGMFSPDYFMYSEDIDLCYKVWKAGWKINYLPTAVVIHHGKASSSQKKINTFSSVMMLESRWRFFKKNRPFWYCILYRILMFFSILARMFILLFNKIPLFMLRKSSPFFNARFKKNLAQLKWNLGLEKWVKGY